MTAAQYAAWLSGQRLRWGLTSTGLARLVGVHRNTVCRWERGIALPNVVMDRAIRKVLREARRQRKERLAAGDTRRQFDPAASDAVAQAVPQAGCAAR